MHNAAGGYQHIDNLRFWAMLAIIARHCVLGWGFAAIQSSGLTQLLLLQGIQFGSVVFYFISGFLLGERLNRVQPARYFRRRLRVLVRPWICWASLYGALLFVHA